MVQTYDMRGRIALIEDAVFELKEAYMRMNTVEAFAALEQIRDLVNSTIAVIEPTPEQKFR